MGNAKSASVVPGLDRRRTAKRAAAKTTKSEDGLNVWQPPGPKSYTAVDTEVPSGERAGTYM